MKIFIQRDGGQLPNYRPQGTVDTDNLSSEEAKTIVSAISPEKLSAETATGRGVRAAGNNSAIPDGYHYHLRIEQEGAVQEFDVEENALPPDAQAALSLLVQKVSRTR